MDLLDAATAKGMEIGPLVLVSHDEKNQFHYSFISVNWTFDDGHVGDDTG
jgi:hypothetical protein